MKVLFVFLMSSLAVVVLNSPTGDTDLLLQCIAVIANSESLGLPSFVTKYNGKPVLINRSGHCESKLICFLEAFATNL